MPGSVQIKRRCPWNSIFDSHLLLLSYEYVLGLRVQREYFRRCTHSSQIPDFYKIVKTYTREEIASSENATE